MRLIILLLSKAILIGSISATNPSCNKNNEVYSSCECHPCVSTCEVPNRVVVCDHQKGCYPGCVCKPGYLRNARGDCVPANSCYRCAPNEVFSDCQANGCQNTCDSPTLSQVCDPLPGCFPGCICKPGFLRNENGTCINANSCPQKCGPNEEPTSCAASGCQITCENPDVIPPCDPFCQPGCVCKSGYLRDTASRACVPINECFQRKCKNNEVYSECGANGCQNTCAQPDLGTFCKGPCIPGCVCGPGYIRSLTNGVCIPQNDCPKCPVNEVYLECGPGGCHDSCDNPIRSSTCDAACTPGCACIAGYIRDVLNGKCIPKKDCYNCSQTEDFSDCGANGCQNTCASPDLITRCDPSPGCQPGCVCKPGYLRNTTNGVCVLPDRCTKCPANEILTECGANGCQDTCENPLLSLVCDAACVPGCACIPGYVRRTVNGQCVPRADCYNCTQEEVFSECGANGCQNTCAAPNLTGINSSCIALCLPGCVCKPGYIREVANGRCIRPRQCVKCTKNEIFTECGANACQNTCDNPTLAQVCRPLPGCFPGCICKPGYLRNTKTGKCVKPKYCRKCHKHEVFTECGAHGCQNTCDNPKFSQMCIPLPGCFPGCICKPGFIRNTATGICVKPKYCPSMRCTKPNEEYQMCGTACPRTCENRHEGPIRCTRQCVPGCFCKPGYVRNKRGECVKPKECDDIVCTGKHEIYTECGNNSCVRDCETYLLTDIACKPDCTPGCICKDGYLRNKKGICVRIAQCENKKCPNNEQFTNCVCPCCENCATLGQNITCNFLVCNPGCDCKPGFFRNSQKVCVRPEKCDCKEHEHFEESVPEYPPRTCDAIGKVYKLPAPGPTYCRPACVCNFNHRRNSDGICVPIQSCPPLICSRPNEVYNPCPNQCLDERCESLYEAPRACPKIKLECQPQCVCQKGYLRNKDGACIPKDSCLKPCQPNEKYNPCPYACPPEDTCDSYLSGVIIDCAPPPLDTPCVPKCECKPGYVRKTPGQCIKQEDCCDDPNAEVVSCPNPCPGGTCEAPQFADCKAPCRIRGCQCKKGYVKDVNGKCILLSRCPKCKTNEVYKMCGTGCPPTCANKCPGCSKKCVAGCFCKEGYTLDRNNGTCIPIVDCHKIPY